MKRPIFRQFPGFALLGVACMFGCASPVGPDAGADAQPLDTGTADSGGPTDAGATDLGDLDAAPGDAIVADVGGLDTGGADASAVTACDPPTQLDSSARGVTSAHIASNGRGSMIAGWLELIDVNNTQQYVARIYSNGAFGPEHRFTPNSSAPPTQALAGTGDAFTFFSGPFPELDAYRSHYDAQGMTWSTPELWLSGGGAGGGSEGSLRVAANARGDAVHVVSGAPQGLRTIFATHYDSALGSWSAVEPLETGAIDSEAVAINDAGDAVAVWLRRDLGPPQLHARALINGVWGPIASIIHGGHRSGASDLEILANGDALVATSSESSVAIRRYSRSAAPGTEWGAPTMLPANIGEAPRLLVDGEGIVTVGWLDGTTGSLRLSVARNLGNGFGVTTDLGPGLTGPTLALDSTGNVSAITRGLPTSVLLTQIAQRGTTWSTPLNVAPTAMDPGRNRSIDVMHDELDHPVVVFDAVTGGVRNLFVTTCR